MSDYFVNDIIEVTYIKKVHPKLKGVARGMNQQLLMQLRAFRDNREYKQFHTAQNLAQSISIEAAELLELFQWNHQPDKESISEELADVMIYCVYMADALGVDIEKIMANKLCQNEEKYPVDKAKGNSKKYTDL